MKTVRVALLPELIEDAELAAADVVIVDVLRATSVMAVAFQAGARRILTCGSIEQALRLAGEVETPPLLCGERGGVPIDGFDLGNSPGEYAAERVADRTLIQTTTNGTRAIRCTAAARRQLTASFLNAAAVLRATADASQLVVVCAGTDGKVTGEDVLLAGMLVEQSGRELGGDQAGIALAYWQQHAERCTTVDGLAAVLAETNGGRNLLRLGYAGDLAAVADRDSLDVVPVRTMRGEGDVVTAFEPVCVKNVSRASEPR